MKKTTLYLPQEPDARLSALAERAGLSKAELVRRLRARALEAPEYPSGLPPSAGSIAEDVGVHADEVERWLRGYWPSELDAPRR